MSENGKPDVTALTVELLSAYVSNNSVPSSELSGLVRTIKAALSEEPEQEASAEEKILPAVSVKASLASRDHIVSLIDGKPYKTLKRHLSTQGMSPDEYRTRYGLPASYPMVAPAYSEQRSQAAREIGLGRKKVETVPVAPARKGRAKAVAGVKTPAKRSRKAPSAAESKDGLVPG